MRIEGLDVQLEKVLDVLKKYDVDRGTVASPSTRARRTGYVTADCVNVEVKIAVIMTIVAMRLGDLRIASVLIRLFSP